MKLNQTIYNKLLAQAEEAKEQGMTKLADGILSAIGPYPAEVPEAYTQEQLSNDIHRDVWKIASRLMVFYDVTSGDAEKIDQTIISWAAKAISDLENTLGVSDLVRGPLEPLVPGEEK